MQRNWIEAHRGASVTCGWWSERWRVGRDGGYNETTAHEPEFKLVKNTKPRHTPTNVSIRINSKATAHPSYTQKLLLRLNYRRRNVSLNSSAYILTNFLKPLSSAPPETGVSLVALPIVLHHYHSTREGDNNKNVRGNKWEVAKKG